MRCRHCGANIPDDRLICPECGAEVQMVPDYNPLEDVLAREVKGSVEGATRQIQTDDIRRCRREIQTRNVNSTRVLSQAELSRIREERYGTARPGGNYGRRNTDALRQQRQEAQRHSTGEIRRQNTGNVRGQRRDNTEEIRRQNRQKRLEAAKKKRRNLLIAIFLLLLLIAAGIFIAYQNSYTGMLNKGYKAIQTKEYTAAEKYFKRAVIKDKSRAEAYIGQAEIYIDQNDLESAEDVFLSAIETQPTNEKLYQAVIDFYMDTEQPGKIAVLLQDCEDSAVLSAVSDYISAEPEFSLEAGTYSEVQEVALSCETGGEIYYTVDGTDPSAETGTKYTEPVLLQNEGETEIRAIAVNDKGIPSVMAVRKYVIEFPIADAPAVTPSTGQYTEPTKITISVPDGYTAYYTLDGSVPDASSTKYTGPVSMPENARTTFKAVLVNNENGKLTEVTTRSYITVNE